MKLLLFLTLSFILISFNAVARSNTFPVGSKSLALSNSTSAQIHLESIFDNQAGLANLNKFQIGIFYDNRFSVDALSTKALAISTPTNIGVVGFQFNTFGKQQWLENNFGICYSRTFSPAILASVGFNYYSTRIPETEELVKQIGANIGAIYFYNKTSNIAVALNHFGVSNQNSVVTDSEIPWNLKLGGSSKLNSNTILYYQLQKYEAQKPQMMAGLDWIVVENFNLRFGLNTNASHFTSGLGYTYNNFEFNLAFIFNQYLGFSPTASIIFSRNKVP